jgi:hypothetical protein
MVVCLFFCVCILWSVYSSLWSIFGPFSVLFLVVSVVRLLLFLGGFFAVSSDGFPIVFGRFSVGFSIVFLLSLYCPFVVRLSCWPWVNC